MPLTGSRPPPAPTCEDCWDEDTHGPHFDNRSSANVAIKRAKSSEFDLKSVADKKSHDGSDSGYSSKAGTSDDFSTTSVKETPELHIETTPIERERHPYTFAPPRPEGTRSSSPTKMKAPKTDKAPKQHHQQQQLPMRHAYGCAICDYYGYHIDMEKDIMRPPTAPPPQSQKIAKSPAPKVRSKEEADSRPVNSRRSSSSSKRQSRPVSMYGDFGSYGFPPAPVDYARQMHANAWQPHPNQMPQYGHFQYPYPPPSPANGGYAHPGFFDMPQMPYTAEPFSGDLNAAGYEDPNRKHRSSKKEKDSSSTRNTSREPRPRSVTKTKATAEADRRSMPPPPVPRPAIPRKAPTEYPSFTSRRYSGLTNDEEVPEVQAIIAKERITSQPRPPSSYKPPTGAEIQSRPRTRKSLSYNVPSGTMQVAETPQREVPRRRTDPYERKLAEAEEHVAKNKKDAELARIEKIRQQKKELLLQQHRLRQQQAIESEESEDDEEVEDEDEEEEYGSQPQPNARRDSGFEKFVAQLQQRPELRSLIMQKMNQDAEPENLIPKMNRLSLKPSLTAETLKIMEKQTGTMSDAGSVRSKQSSSRESGMGRIRSGTGVTSNARVVNITTKNGISLSIPTDCGDTPLNFMLDGLHFSMNSGREDETFPQLRAIENTPSEVSHVSHRSLTNDSLLSASKGRDDQFATRNKHSSYSSKKSSRAPSTTRPERREVRSSIDYSVVDSNPESFYQLY